MIESLTVENYLGESMVIDLRDPSDTGFLIYNIDGLGPGSSSVLVTEFAGSDGGVFNSARTGPRNIVITARLLFAPTVSESRRRTYTYFPLKKEVKLTFKARGRSAWIKGYVEKNDPIIFTKEEHTQISIICPDPNFYAVSDEGVEEQVVDLFSVEPFFEFPYFSNRPKIVGEITRKEEGNLVYEGDSEIGVVLTIRASGDVVNLKIANRTEQTSMVIDDNKLKKLTGSGIKNGDEVIINTNRGSKSVILLRDGKKTNILNCLDRYTNWFTLSKGDNIFAIDADRGSENVHLSISYKTAYEGI